MKIILNKTKQYQIGNVRVNKDLFDKITKIAKENKVSNQEIVRAILENVIDTIEIK